MKKIFFKSIFYCQDQLQIVHKRKDEELSLRKIERET